MMTDRFIGTVNGISLINLGFSSFPTVQPQPVQPAAVRHCTREEASDQHDLFPVSNA
jgi:hypothetical protein